LQTPECSSDNGAVQSGNPPHVSFTASGNIPFTAAGSPISGPVTVSASGTDGKCVNAVSLDGIRISGPTWFDKPCDWYTPSTAVPQCVSAIRGTGQLKVGFHSCQGEHYGGSSGNVFAQFSSNGATSWGSGPLAGTLTLTMKYADGFCSEGITVNGQLVNSEKFWLYANAAGTIYNGVPCIATKTIQIGM